MRLLIGLALALPLVAQSTPPSSAPASKFYGIFVTGYASTHPQPAGGMVLATEISASQQIYSFNETDWIPVRQTGTNKYTVQTSARSGFATMLRKFGPATLYALADAGVATNGGATGAAYAGGGVLTIPLKSGWILFPGVRMLKSSVGGTQVVLGLGIGKEEK